MQAGQVCWGWAPNRPRPRQCGKDRALWTGWQSLLQQTNRLPLLMAFFSVKIKQLACWLLRATLPFPSQKDTDLLNLPVYRSSPSHPHVTDQAFFRGCSEGVSFSDYQKGEVGYFPHPQTPRSLRTPSKV